LNALTPVEAADVRLPASLTRGVGPAGALGPVGTVELRELRYFAAAARAGNLARAAQELNVTASAISQQLRKLEDQFGTQLLIRHGRGVIPTPAGAALLERIDDVLRLLAAPLEQPPPAPSFCGTVTVAVPTEVGALLAAPLVEQVRRRWPDLALQLQDAAGDGIVSRLLGGKVDIALLQDPPELDELMVQPLLTEALGLVVSPRSALARNSQPMRLRDLAGVTLVLPNPRHSLRRLLARVGFQRGVRFDVAVQVDGAAMTKAMVRNGTVCTILPAAAVSDEIARGALVFRLIEQPGLTITQAIATRRQAAPIVREVAAAIGEAIRSLATDGTWPGARLVAGAIVPTPIEARALDKRPDTAPEPWQLPRREPMRSRLEFAEGD
jgi:LysR family nitrogen assimilation transcriptional regulator